MPPAWKLRLRILLALVGLAILAYLVARIGPSAIGAHLASVGPGILWLFVAYGAGTAVGSFPWFWLLPEPARPGVGGAIASRFAASGANAVLPLFAIGGEPCRLLWLKPEHRAAGIAGLVVDRLLFAGASVLFLLAGVIAILQIASVPRVHAIAVGTLAVGTLIASAVLAWLVANHRLAGRIHGLVHRLRRGAGKTLTRGAFGDGIDDRLTELLKGRRGPLVAGTAVHFAARALLGAEIYVGLLVLGVAVTPTEGLVLAAVPVVLVIVGAWIPSQIGLQEGAVAFACGLLGIDPAAGLTVVVLQRIRQVGTVTLAWALLSMPRQKRAKAALAARPRASGGC